MASKLLTKTLKEQLRTIINEMSAISTANIAIDFMKWHTTVLRKKIMMSTRCWWIKSFYVDCNKKLTVKLTKLPSFITLSYVKKISGVEVELGTYKKYLFSKSKSTSLYHVLELVRVMKSPYYPCISTDKCLWKRRLNFILHIVWFCLHFEIFWLN